MNTLTRRRLPAGRATRKAPSASGGRAACPARLTAERARLAAATARCAILLVLALLASVSTGCGGPAADRRPDATRKRESRTENIALGRPYTLSANPNYQHCTDPGDRTQLTDGIYTRRYFWTQTSTVGWRNALPPIVRIDLGREQPIRGVSWSTAAGVAGVSWPEAVYVFVSPDGQEWFEVGDLVALSARRDAPPAEGYATHVFRTEELRTRGRYVALAATPQGPYLFCDEVEVFRGDDAWLTQPPGGRAVANPRQAMGESHVTHKVQQQLRRDLTAVQATLDASGLDPYRLNGLAARADALLGRINTMPRVETDGFRAVLPMTDLEREIFALQAAVWRARSEPLLRIWQSHRWDPLAPSAEPPASAGSPVLAVHAMQNERRADVLNLTNASEEPLSVRLRVTGLPGGPNPRCLQVHEVLHVGTRHFTAVAAALPEARRDGDAYVVTVPAGMTRQVWLALDTAGLAPGEYEAAVHLDAGEAGTRRVSLRLKVWPLRMPDAKTLHLGGWSYTNGRGVRGVTPANRDAFIRYLRSRHVSTPWATVSALPPGRFDAKGTLIKPPDTAEFDAWVRRWPGAARYMVFASVWSRASDSSTFAGSKVGTPLFEKKVGAWIRFWAGHMRDLGLEADRLGLLLVDEPNRPEQYAVIRAWAEVIHRAAPEVVVWEDPCPRTWDGFQAMAEACDILVPNRGHWLTRDEAFRNRFRALRKAGKRLGFYSCDGPARCFDPYSYYLAQAWHAFGEGGTWMGFWAFGDNGRASCWNEFVAAGKGPYCPLYIDAESVTPAKYMEAIGEGVQDYETLVMLRQRLAALKRAGKTTEAVARAERLLDSAVGRVLAREDGTNYRWDEAKDRAAADRVRLEVLEALVALPEP